MMKTYTRMGSVMVLLAVALILSCCGNLMNDIMREIENGRVPGSLVSESENFTSPDSFEYTISNDQVTITGFIGTETDISIPRSIEGYPVSTIGRSAFEDCRSLSSVIIPDSVTSIGDLAFRFCISLSSVIIPDSVTIIGDWAFYYCISLSSVIIPDSVTLIGVSAFQDCRSLSSVTVKATTPPKLASVVFVNCNALSHIYVPAGTLDEYKDAWSHYKYIIVEQQ